jgi:dTDP-glucose 4,6-dehydratase
MSFSEKHRLLITGGCGFIGSNLIRHLMSETDWEFANVDRLSYAANSHAALQKQLCSSNRYEFHSFDINDKVRIDRLLKDFQPTAILHLAAETHVDRSIDDPQAFVDSNVMGTMRLLQSAREYWSDLTPERSDSFRFVNVSTDEVFGSLPHDEYASDQTRFAPRSPYSASKAAADHFVSAWQATYGLPTLTARLSNVYGPFQFPEKLIPLAIIKALRQEPIPVYGTGENRRDWLFVDDACRGLQAVISNGVVGRVYQFSTRQSITNLELLGCLLDEMERQSHLQEQDAPTRASSDMTLRQDQGNPHNKSNRSISSHARQTIRELLTFVPDRPGHDERYALDSQPTSIELGWQSQVGLTEGLRTTIAWYLANQDWWEPILRSRYSLQRLGLGVAATGVLHAT